jgi:hypothetical protein
VKKRRRGEDPVLWFLWVSSVPYPNLLGLKGFLVVVKITIYGNIAIIQQAEALLFTKHLSLLFQKALRIHSHNQTLLA